jgi:hypothetical protein
MKAYLAITGLAFVLIAAAHVARVIAEGLHLLKEPIFLFTPVLSLACATWAWRLLRQLSRPGKES